MKANSKDQSSRVDAAENILVPLNREGIDWTWAYEVYHGLPPCQRQIVDLLIGRLEPKQIAYELDITVSTVRTQLQTVRKKLAVESNHEVALIIANALFERAAVLRSE
jgi:DNA-binding NarL/FixJ family response regulator